VLGKLVNTPPKPHQPVKRPGKRGRPIKGG
jgi:hypothetical protein